MKAVDVITAVLVIIGGINWGLVGLFRFDLVALICTGDYMFGSINAISRVIYALVGVSAVYQAVSFKGLQHRWASPAHPTGA